MYATDKQINLINDMKKVLDNEFDFGTISNKETYTVREASKLIWLNKDVYFGIIDEGQCTIKQYNELTRIAGRKPKIERYLIGFTQANMWIAKYSINKAA
jgi:hypothetical protein